MWWTRLELEMPFLEASLWVSDSWLRNIEGVDVNF